MITVHAKEMRQKQEMTSIDSRFYGCCLLNANDSASKHVRSDLLSGAGVG